MREQQRAALRFDERRYLIFSSSGDSACCCCCLRYRYVDNIDVRRYSCSYCGETVYDNDFAHEPNVQSSLSCFGSRLVSSRTVDHGPCQKPKTKST
mmetsp:Transcript_2574/g.5802  ORF Transcript_2574/g.5802 Transcript_2574/m.5802 type:complete len:96 (-) Transcript_2574:8-295(-)